MQVKVQVRWGAALLALAGLSAVAFPARAETPEQWIELGTRVHGGFGAFIPAGIRIGLDALARLKAEPRGVTVTFYSGEKAPCPCIADGVMLATQASPGQGTLQVAAEKAPAGELAVIVICDRKGGAGLRYGVADGMDGQDRGVEQDPRSRRALSGGDVGAGIVRGRARALTCGRKNTVIDDLRSPSIQALAAGLGLIRCQSLVMGVSSL